ncbi:hypothetical protein AYJ54_45720 [Bradyrhizobium centrolobii]|uniref:Uncharacterized protein n=1 Tax=Bradyrhizobium centrolobii TaxID=1505087 RepID=A0A176YZ39_9BRAD|nr:hypothetical protein [Bradyrhizobium centrolobii]OAF13034.1 hypothetical protein AYJ54_45720 [Bradyrhizobium centrolobii]
MNALATLAPISRSEKPHLFPWRAVCFGSTQLSILDFAGVASAACARGVRGHCQTFPFGIAGLFSASHDASIARCGDRIRVVALHTGITVLLLNFSSSLHSGFRFGLNRHKFATGAVLAAIAAAVQTTTAALATP